MQNKAIHYGTCQWCGRRQKLPGSRLSVHGYTTKWHFFQGVCHGAGHPPYELSCDLIHQAIDAIQRQVSATRERIENFAKPATESKAWVSVGRGIGQPRSWSYLDIEATEHVSAEGDFKWLTFSAVTSAGERIEVLKHSFGVRSILEAATKCNQHYVDSQQRELRELEGYLCWQRERVASWQPKALTPIGVIPNPNA